MFGRRNALAAITGLFTLACTQAAGPPKATSTEPTRLCVDGAALSPARCRSARDVEALLGDAPVGLLRSRPTPGGAQGAHVVTLVGPGRDIVEAKWRPLSATTPTNDPASERLAHALQAIVLPPEDHVVPPAVTRCLELPGEPPGECELGVLSYWLTGSTTLRDARRAGLLPMPDGGVWSGDPQLFQPTRFASDPAYRRAVAHLNLVAHLIDHGDAHTAQFVLYRDPLHFFLVDNSVAFGVHRNAEMDARQDLSRMIVPALPADTAARLRALRPAELRALAVVDTWQRTPTGLVRLDGHPPLGDPEARVRRADDLVQIGLRASELDALLARVAALQRALADGSLQTFPP